MTRRLVTFTLDGALYGVDVRRVQEARRPQPRTVVPLAPAEIAGLVNLRGQLVTAIDLRRRLDLPPLPSGTEPMMVVVQVAGEPISLFVDEVSDVVDVTEDDFEAPPETLDARVRDLVRGAYKLADRLLLALDVYTATATSP
jgi:purine-binding chemotaxis protein CheW